MRLTLDMTSFQYDYLLSNEFAYYTNGQFLVYHYMTAFFLCLQIFLKW